MNIKDYEKVETPLVSFRVELKCPECGEGYLEFNGKQKMCCPPKNSHTCNYCGYSTLINGEEYPCIKYKTYESLNDLKIEVEEILD